MNRRSFISAGTTLSAGSILGGVLTGRRSLAEESALSKENIKKTEMEVTAIEDLMREHGILRRILIVYSETARKLRVTSEIDMTEQINKAALLFRNFGEEYHEKALEEIYIFPAVIKTSGEAATYPEILIAQHRRGREITDYILEATKETKISDTRQLASAMDSFVRMYRPHAAREDTIVFPAWKQTLSMEQFDELSEKFEEIEHEQFGEGGFEKAVSQVADIEKRLGLADLSQFTPKP